MSNAQIVQELKRDLILAKRAYKKSYSESRKLHIKKLIKNIQANIADLEGAIAMGADSNNPLEGWVKIN